MTLYQPLYMQAGSYSASLDRQLLNSLISVGGIIGVGDLKVSQRAAGANMSVDVASGRAAISGTDTTGQGKYLVWSDAVVNVPIAASPPAGQSRIDLIVAQIRDATVIGGANNDFIITAITGVAAATGSQVAPAAPNSSIVLAQVAVGPTVATIVTANITDLRLSTTLPPQRNPFQCSVHATGASTLTNVAFSILTMAAVDYDPNGNWNGTTTWTCPVAGRYRINGASALAAVASVFQVAIYKNGAQKRLGNQISATVGNNLSTVEAMLTLAAGDTIDLRAYQNTGGAANNLATEQTTYLDIALESAA